MSLQKQAQAAMASGAAERYAAASEREKRCNQVATEQALTGAKRKTFISGCMAG